MNWSRNSGRAGPASSPASASPPTMTGSWRTFRERVGTPRRRPMASLPTSCRGLRSGLRCGSTGSLPGGRSGDHRLRAERLWIRIPGPRPDDEALETAGTDTGICFPSPESLPEWPGRGAASPSAGQGCGALAGGLLDRKIGVRGRLRQHRGSGSPSRDGRVVRPNGRGVARGTGSSPDSGKCAGILCPGCPQPHRSGSHRHRQRVRLPAITGEERRSGENRELIIRPTGRERRPPSHRPGAAAFLPPTGSGGFLVADWERRLSCRRLGAATFLSPTGSGGFLAAALRTHVPTRRWRRRSDDESLPKGRYEGLPF